MPAVRNFQTRIFCFYGSLVTRATKTWRKTNSVVMGRESWIGRIAILALLAQLLFATAAFGQAGGPAALGPKPIMENVFFNVVWGSAFGVLMGAAVSVVEAEKKTSPPDMRSRAYYGATWGGIIGLGVGVWLATSGITYDPDTAIFFARNGGQDGRVAWAVEPPPFILETSKDGSNRITGFRATVLRLKF